MNYDDSTALLLKMEISHLIRFYNSATPLQKQIIKKQLKIVRLSLKKNQYFLRKKCKQTGHSYTQWFQVPSANISRFCWNPEKYKVIRTCHICGYYEIQKRKKFQ